MIQLTVLMWNMAALFGYIGFSRGWNKEMISTAGIILGLFALFQFDSTLNTFLIGVPGEQKFMARALIFSVIVFFAYHTRALIGEEATRPRSRSSGGRDNLQSSVLGGIIGFLNGYLIWGSLWYFMILDEYPLSPYISAPQPDSPSARFVESLPLYILAGGPGGDGDLLAGAVIFLFLLVLIVI